jgi:hypothetical protein
MISLAHLSFLQQCDGFVVGFTGTVGFVGGVGPVGVEGFFVGEAVVPVGVPGDLVGAFVGATTGFPEQLVVLIWNQPRSIPVASLLVVEPTRILME